MEPNAFDRLLAGLKFAKDLLPKSKKAEVVFRYEPRDFPVCDTRVVREKRGFPWNHQVTLHTMPDGTVQMRRVEAPPPKKQIKSGPLF